jgi:exodeoxyribonuclease III
MTVRVATWNVNSIASRLERATAWLAANKPDVLCVQELKLATEDFPTDAMSELGYESAAHGDGRWNGVAILSRIGLEDVVRDLPGQPEYEGVVELRAISATCGPIRVCSVYVPNGREVDHPHYLYKLRWLQAMVESAAAEGAQARPFAVLGDFNIAPTDLDVWDPAVFEGATHVTAKERAALDALREAGLSEAVPRPLKHAWPFTFWDYRQLAFPKNRGMRIDLVFGNPAFTGAVTDAYVDRNERKGAGSSDHAPVVVDLDL